MRGRKKKPTRLRVIEGNRGKRPLPKNEPAPPPGDLAPPDWIDLEARKEWNRIVPVLDELELYKKPDVAAIACYCQAYSWLIAARRTVGKTGRTSVGARGIQSSPHFRQAKDMMIVVKQFCAEFGMTPSARGRIELPAPEDGEKDPAAKYLA